MAQSSKFNLPGTNAAFVRRQSVTERIERAASAKLVLVRAPAGFGKTTALRQIHEQLEAEGTATAWITLDAADNDVPRFLSCLAEAVARLHIADEARSGADAEAIALLEREGPAFALFLDEFEVLQAPAVVGLVREVIERLPRNGRLVLGSRSLPDLGLGRLRVRGQLLEIGVDVLRFSVDETAEFLRLRGLPDLPRDALEQLHARTEGWIAALLLASMALDRHAAAADFIHRLSGSSGAIAEYLAEDVLGRQPPDAREFLLRTSILRQLSAPLCQVLVPRTDCARMLERLNASSLFLLPVEAEGSEPNFRYHSLFANFLRTQLQREHPEELLRLHLAAAAWYESVGRPVPAIDHAIEGGDHPHALSLLEQHAQRFLEQGRIRLLARWFAAIPAATLREHPLMQAIYVWAVLFTQGATEGMALLAGSGIEASEDPVIRAHVNALRPLLLAMQDRYDEANEVGRAGLARLPTAVPFADTALTNCMAHITSVLGEKREAQRLLDAARRTQSSSVFNRMYTESTEGLLDFERGRFRQATARFRIAVDATTREADYSHTGGNAWAGVLYAAAMYEADELDVVDRLLNVYLPLARDVGLPDHMISSYAMRSRLLFWHGDVDGASRVLTELETLGHLRKLPRVVATAKLERARMLIRQGNAYGAREELDRADDPAVWERVARQRLPAHDVLDIGIARLRWQVHFGDTAAAVRRIDDDLPAVDAEARVRRSRKLRVLKAMALWRLKSADEAAEVMRGILQEGSREGFVRLVVDEGPAVAGPIQAVLAPLKAAPQQSDPILIEYAQRLLDALGPEALAAEPAPATAEVPWQVEPLTQKELQVLKLLAEGYSNSAMSEKLFVSDSTVRTHLRNINMKLGAQNRTQAVSLARRYGLIR
ncbi:helix-turn-helix transcriptional regulator [Ramlibacter henchirensis]|uniref:Helix-turn-helix transcriptional regulator n=2 Tax=Ramlibacter henchirensis TaxID=204072 RepID=A0A4Z0BXC1_9BURK|nr:helix-turn-helix transcriptional regulator [Ramlibacter henchirensis]